MFPVIKTFFQLHLWPFWGLAETSPESKKVNFDERGNLISTGPSTHGDHLIRFSNRKRLKERGGFFNYLINWSAVASLFLIMGALVRSQILYIVFTLLFVASFMMSGFLMLLYWAVDKKSTL